MVRAQPNLAVTAATEPRGPILFMGDSITALWGMHRTALFVEHGFINRGIGSEMSGQVRARLAPAIAETRPASVYILCGINDIAHRAAHGEDKDLRGNITAMLVEIWALGVRTEVRQVRQRGGRRSRGNGRAAAQFIRCNSECPMLKPVYVVAASRTQQSGWFIADESGAILPNGRAYSSRYPCYEAIAKLTR